MSPSREAQALRDLEAARDLAAALEQRLTLAERVVEAGRDIAGRYRPHAHIFGSYTCAECRLRDALAAYDEAVR